MNYFAICKETNSVIYFGEDVDNIENAVVVNHDGSWLAGVKGARAGLIMPGMPLLGARYYQEVAPGVALDRAEIESLDVRRRPHPLPCPSPAHGLTSRQFAGSREGEEEASGRGGRSVSERDRASGGRGRSG